MQVVVESHPPKSQGHPEEKEREARDRGKGNIKQTADTRSHVEYINTNMALTNMGDKILTRLKLLVATPLMPVYCIDI